jgi:prephenate dehydrogenase
MPTPARSTLALLGTGYMGGSLALAARQAGLVGRVVGFDAVAGHAAQAQARGILDEVAPTPELAASQADLVVLATPVGSLAPLAARIAPAVGAEAVVIDIGSVKGPVVAAIEATDLGGRFVGCHPLAGTEVSGPTHADERLYAGKPCFVCPGPRATEAAIGAAERLWSGVGATLLRMTADAHDAFMAAASHLPHVGAFAVAGALAGAAEMLEATIPASFPPTSLRDTTRVAASSPVMWRDIFIANRAHLLPLVGQLEARLAELRGAIERGDEAALEAFLTRARACRRRVVKTG